MRAGSQPFFPTPRWLVDAAACLKSRLRRRQKNLTSEFLQIPRAESRFRSKRVEHLPQPANEGRLPTGSDRPSQVTGMHRNHQERIGRDSEFTSDQEIRFCRRLEPADGIGGKHALQKRPQARIYQLPLGCFGRGIG